MVEGSAAAQLSRAMNTRTTRSAEALDLHVGDQVDFYKTPNTKDASGWYGPATVIDTSKASRGVITIRYNNQVTEAQLPNLRRHMAYWTLLASPAMQTFHTVSAWETIAAAPEQLPPGQLKQFGAVWHGHKWVASASDSKFPGWFRAVTFLQKTR